MSKNRRKSPTAKPAKATEEPMASRIVAIPKTPETRAPEPEPELAPPADVWAPVAPTASAPEESMPRYDEPVVILQEPEPRRDPVVIAPAPKPEPTKAEAKPKQKAKSERIGDILREARLERNDDLYQIAEYLCIKPSFLIALENSRYDEFPADAYVIGFLRTYANFLGVDGREAIDRYRYEMAGRRKKPVLSMPTPVSEGRAPSGIIMVGATIAVLLIYALWYGVSSSNRAEVRVPPPLPTTTQAVPAVPADSSATGLTAPVTGPSAPETIPAATAAPAATPAATPAPAPAPAPVATPPQPAPQTSPQPSTSAAPAPSNAVVIPPASPGIMVTADQPAGAANAPAAAPAAAKDDAAESKAAAKALAKQQAKEAKEAKEAAAKAAKQEQDAQKPAADAGNSRVTVRATQSSWIMVTDQSGKTIFDRVLKPGEMYKVPSKPGLSLTTGNGSGIVLSLDGADLPKVANGAPHVVRNIALDPDRLSTEPVVAADH